MNKIIKLIQYSNSYEDDGDKDWKLIKLKSMCESISNDKDLMKKLEKILDKTEG